MNRHSRRYGRQHKALRARYKRQLAAGIPLFWCRCHRRIQPWDKWHLDHKDGSNTSYMGVAHAGCNLATVTHARERAERAEEALSRLRAGEAT